MERGILYVMDTVVDGLVKIGKTGTDNFNKRMYNLEHNGYCNVVGLKRRFAIEVDDYENKERLLHTIFERSQVGNSELFSLDIEIVVQLLSSFDGDIIYPKKMTKDEVFDQAVEEALKESDGNNDLMLDDDTDLSPSDKAKIVYWNRFYEHVNKDQEMKKLFNDISGRKDNTNNYVSFALGFGSDCRLDVLHRTKGAGSIIVQIWCKTDKYYPDLYDGKSDIEEATAALPGTLEWDGIQENKTSRKAEVKKECSVNDTEDFEWAVSWLKALHPAIHKILDPIR